jgi:hypothetical protein
MYYHWGKCLFARKGGVYQNYWMVVHNIKENTFDAYHPDFDPGVVTNAVGWCTCLMEIIGRLLCFGDNNSVPVSHMLEDQDGYAGYFEDHTFVSSLAKVLISVNQ